MPPAGGGQNQADNHMAPVWIIVSIFVVVFAIWYLFRIPLIKGFLFVKLLEIDAIAPFTSSLNGLRQVILTTNPTDFSYASLVMIANKVGNYTAFFAGFFLLLFAILLYRKSIGLRFRQTYTMKTLLKVENVNWPQTTPIVGLDLIKEDIETGPWAMAKTPMQFAKINNLLKEQKKVAEEGMLSREAKLEVILNKPKTVEVFVRQLGRPWQGIDALNMHTKALFAIFVARLNNDIEAAAALMRQIAASSHSKKLNFSGVRELLEKHRNNPLIEEVTSRHAFVFTVMASILELSRTVGVEASADFLWLKPIDRRLWYMLNAVGRQTPQSEVAGPFAHWLVEKSLNRRVVTPMIDEAVKGLEGAIASVIYKPGEDQ